MLFKTLFHPALQYDSKYKIRSFALAIHFLENVVIVVGAFGLNRVKTSDYYRIRKKFIPHASLE